MSFGELYAFAFFKLRGWFHTFADDGLQDWKGILALGVVQIYVIYGAVFFLEGSTGISILPAAAWVLAVPISIAVIAVNYFSLLHRERWRKYENVFRRYSVLKNRVLVALLILVVVAALVFGFAMVDFGVRSTT